MLVVPDRPGADTPAFAVIRYGPVLRATYCGLFALAETRAASLLASVGTGMSAGPQ